MRPCTPICAPNALALPLSFAVANSVPLAMPSCEKVCPLGVGSGERSSACVSSTDECPQIGPPPIDQSLLICQAKLGWTYTVARCAFLARKRPGKSWRHCEVRPYGTYTPSPYAALLVGE